MKHSPCLMAVPLPELSAFIARDRVLLESSADDRPMVAELLGLHSLAGVET